MADGPGSVTGPGPLWTVGEALEVFAAQGMPVDEWRLRLAIRAVSLPPAARTPVGPQGGKGFALYPAGALQRMHALIIDLAPETTAP